MMKRFIAIGLLFSCLPPCVQAKGDRKPFQIYNFSKGVDTYHNPYTLPEGFVQDSLNILYDDKSPASKRSGYTTAWSTTSSYAFTGQWTYTDSSNTSWQIVRSSTQITASNLAGTTIKIATVTANNTVGEANAFGFAYFVDQTQGVYYWNGSSTTYVGSSSPLGSIITAFHNRLWVTGAAVPNGNQLYGSGYYAGNNWTTGVNATDPVQYSIGLQDNFDNVTAEYVYLDTLYVFKHYAIFALYGFDQTNFQISQLTQECGCIDGGSIQTYNGGLKFVSLRGVEDFNGYSCKRISDPIKNKIDPAIQAGSFSQQSWIQSTNADWSAGTFNPSVNLSTAVANPSLTSSTFTITFTSSTWNVPNNGFEQNSGELSVPTGWTKTGVANGFVVLGQTAGSCGSASPRTGSWYLDMSTGAVYSFPFRKFDVIDANTGSSINSFSENSEVDQCGWHKDTISMAGSMNGSKGRVGKIQISLGNGANVITSSTFTIGADITYYYQEFFDPIGNLNHIAFDDIASGSSTYTSSATLIGFATGYITVSSVGGSSVTVQGANDGNLGPWTNILTTTGTSTAFLADSYIRVTSSFTRSPSDSSITDLQSVTVIAASTGAFKSPIKNIGTIGSFGNFLVSETLNSGNISFTVCSSTFSNMASPVSCTSPSINTPITNTVVTSSTTYVQLYATFSITAATQSAILNSVAVQWFSGNHAPPMASTVWDNRYWLSLTTVTIDTANDAVEVLNQTGAWANFDIHAGGFTQYKGSLYHADSAASGKIYLDNQGYSDNGSAINVYFKTKDLSLGDLASDDYLYAIYPAVLPDGACAVSFQYDMDHAGVNYSLGAPLESEFSTLSSVRLPFPIDTSHQDFGQSINFTIGTNDATCPFNFIGLDGLYKQRPIN